MTVPHCFVFMTHLWIHGMHVYMYVYVYMLRAPEKHHWRVGCSEYQGIPCDWNSDLHQPVKG